MFDEHTQWITIGAFIFFLLFLLLREIFLASRIPVGHPTRGLVIFNVVMLFFFNAACVFGALYLWNADAAARAYFSVYPNSRYALERYPTSNDGESIFLTYDTTTGITGYYAHAMKDQGNALVDTNEGTTTRLAIGTTSSPQFLTVVDEGGQRALHYSTKGSIMIVSVPH